MIELFEDTGEFWLPDNPSVKVGGTVSYSPGERPKLRLTGSFRSLEEEIQSIARIEASTPEKIILGRTAQARNITLYECRDAGKTVDIEYGGTTEKWMEASALFRGAHFATEEDIQFKKITVELSHLDEWANLFVVDPREYVHDPKSRTRTIIYRIPEPLEIELKDHWRIRLGLEVTGPEFRHPQKGIHVASKTCLELFAPMSRTFEQFVRKLWTISTFISLATQQPVFPLRFTGRVCTPSGEEASDVSGASVDVMYYVPELKRPSKELVPPHDMLFVLADVLGDPGCHIRSWQDAIQAVRPVLNLYFAELSQLRIHLEPRFLRLIQALEGYHRRRIGRTELPEKQHENRVQEILEAVPEKYRGWLGGKLRNSNEPNLQTRLSDICKRYKSVMNRISRNRSWIETAVGIRNDLAHQKEDSTQYEVAEILTVSERLKLLLDLCLLTEAGFAPTDIELLINRYWQRDPPLLARDSKRMML